MSGFSIAFVPRVSEYPDHEARAEEILRWLISLDIVQPESDAASIYSVSEGASKVTEVPEFIPFEVHPNGLEVVTRRTVFDGGANGLDAMICPSCRENIASDNWDLDRWYNRESDGITCTRCGVEAEVHRYRFIPEFGFSNLGFIFWNWPPFTNEFIEEFGRRMGCEISVVHRHI